LDTHRGFGQNAGMSTPLETELATFRRELPALLADPANQGKYVLIHGGEIAGIFPDVESGLEAGYDRFELAPFLVKQIAAREEPKYFSRNLRCPT
jgi:hypothetical protein